MDDVIHQAALLLHVSWEDGLIQAIHLVTILVLHLHGVACRAQQQQLWTWWHMLLAVRIWSAGC